MASDTEGLALDLLALEALPGISRGALMKALFPESPTNHLNTPPLFKMAPFLHEHQLSPADLASTKANLAPTIQGLALMDARLIAALSSHYPRKLLRHLGWEAPPLIHLCGNSALLAEEAGGIVGTRKPSAEGRTVTQELAAYLARQGHVVVSGGAQGVDDTAQQAALAAGGRLIIVLAQGLLSYSPPPYLEKALGEGRVLLFSEWAPDAPWKTYAAVLRNKTISALSRMICVIEPQAQGGSIQTARAALEQGKSMLWLPPINSSSFFQGWANAQPLVTSDADRMRAQVKACWKKEPAPLPKQADLWE